MRQGTDTGAEGAAQALSGNIVICAKRNDPFARVPKEILDDARLTWKAKAILAYLIGKPAGWKMRVNDLVKRAKDGKAAVRTGLQELRETGYAQLAALRDAGGKLLEWVWKISDSPIFEPPDTDFRDLENRHHSKNDTQKEKCLKKAKGSSATADASSLPAAGFESHWKPDTRTKEQKLRAIPSPKAHTYPHEQDFLNFVYSIDAPALGILVENRDLYHEICVNKWHVWKPKLRRWVPIKDWQAFIRGLGQKTENAAFKTRRSF